jgi:hypothetical protein
MSIFKTITTAVQGEDLVDSSNYSANANITISQIKVTNHGGASVLVSVWLDDDGSDKYIFETNIPKEVTMIFDDPFSYPQTSELKVTTVGDSALTIIVN